ncbi:helix-turn-helix domain-containing protein [Egicoccus sp. AB-alg2]|uniref:helix-turn-helix domain-containing protein n=1 Tax=Egicoccus sp. AB-alg2 TaxID=3242693 RepID=UPI00359EE2B8
MREPWPAARHGLYGEEGVADTLGRSRLGSIGRVIREQRLARGLTQREAAARAGVSVGAWRSTESGTRRPRPQTFAAILRSLELSADDARHASVESPYLDVAQAREELVRRCRDELPDTHVELVLRLVDAFVEAAAGRPPSRPGREE